MKTEKNVLPVYIHQAVDGLIGNFGLSLAQLLRGDDSDENDNWLTILEACKLARVSRWTIRRWAQDGMVKTIKVNKKRAGKVLVNKASLRSLLEKSAQNSEDGGE